MNILIPERKAVEVRVEMKIDIEEMARVLSPEQIHAVMDGIAQCTAVNTSTNQPKEKTDGKQ